MISQLVNSQYVNGGKIPCGTLCFGSKERVRNGIPGFMVTTMETPEGYNAPQTFFVAKHDLIIWADDMPNTEMAMAIHNMALAAQVEESQLVVIYKRDGDIAGYGLLGEKCTQGPVFDGLFGQYVEKVANKMGKSILYGAA